MRVLSGVGGGWFAGPMEARRVEYHVEELETIGFGLGLVGLGEVELSWVGLLGLFFTSFLVPEDNNYHRRAVAS